MMRSGNNGFLGRAGRCVAGVGFRVAESSYSAGVGLPKHSHARAHLCLVVSGEYRETLRGATEARGPMTLIYYPPDCPHAEVHRTGGRHFLLEWDAEWIHRLDLDSALPDGPLEVDRPAAMFAGLRAFRLLRDNASVVRDVEVALVAVLDEMNDDRKREAQRAPAWLTTIVRRLGDDPDDARGLAEFANDVRVHPSHLARTFRRFMGCTLGQMQRRFQTQEACRRLTGGSDALCHVAVDSGFSDQSHLTRSLREATGFTPLALRDACGESQLG